MHKLQSIVAIFRQILDDGACNILASLVHFPNGACGDTSDLLATYLRTKGLGEFTYVSGKRNGNTHAWLEQNGLIIDITADQFGEGQSPVIITTSSSWHHTFQRLSVRKAEAPFDDPIIGRDFREAYDSMVTALEGPA